MLEARLSTDLQALVPRLDDRWEVDQAAVLPFPIAYPLARLRAEGYAWEFLLKDMLEAVLRYLAVVGVSDYLHAPQQVDFDLNEDLKKLAHPLLVGQWLSIVRRAARRKGVRTVPELAAAFEAVEAGSLKVKLSFPKHRLATESQGLLSTLVTARNSLFGHGSSLSAEEKKQATPIILSVLRATLYGLSPVFALGLAQAVGLRGNRRVLVLKGLHGFLEAGVPIEGGSALLLKDGTSMPLHPLVFTASAGPREQATLVDTQSEVYLLNEIARKTPVYLGVAGWQTERSDLRERLGALLDAKRVWEPRQDIELDAVLEYSRRKLRERLEWLVGNNIYDPDRFVPRLGIDGILGAFFRESQSRALVLAGRSGIGKTVAVLHALAERLKLGDGCLLLRAVELDNEILKPKALERRLCAELGYVGPFADILDRISQHPSRRFVVVIDGLNEFTAAGRDSSLLFRRVSDMIADVSKFTTLKVVVTARAEGIQALLPDGRLPQDFDESLWHRQDGRPYATLGALSGDEAQALLENLGVPPEAASRIALLDSDAARNPDLLRKLSVGALDVRDMSRLDARGITNRFIDERLGRDRTLRQAVEELVGVMGKQKDPTLTEAVLASRAPALYRRLRERGSRLLMTLRELGLVQVIDTLPEEGTASWSIALTHDTLFEALRARQRRRQARNHLLFLSGAFAFVVLASLGFSHILLAQFRQRVESTIAKSQDRLETTLAGMDAPSDEKGRIRVSYGNVLATVEGFGLELARITQVVFHRTIACLGLPMFMILLLGRVWDAHAESSDKREVRIQFYSAAEDEALAKGMHKAIVPMVALGVVGSAVGFIQQASLVVTLAPMAICLLTIVAAGVPGVTWLAIRRAARGSTLLKEAIFAPESLRRRMFSSARHAATFTAAVAALAGLMHLSPASLFLEDDPVRDLRLRAAERFSHVDWEVLRPFPGIGGKPLRELPSALEQAADEYNSGIFRRQFFSRDVAGEAEIFAGLAVLWGVFMIELVGSSIVFKNFAQRVRPVEAGGSQAPTAPSS